MAPRPKKPMARMSLESGMTKEKKRLRKIKPRIAQLEARDVSQPNLFAVTGAGEGLIRVPVELLKRLGWEYGARMFLSELPPGPCFAEKPALLIEME